MKESNNQYLTIMLLVFLGALVVGSYYMWHQESILESIYEEAMISSESVVSHKDRLHIQKYIAIKDALQDFADENNIGDIESSLIHIDTIDILKEEGRHIFGEIVQSTDQGMQKYHFFAEHTENIWEVFFVGASMPFCTLLAERATCIT